MLSIGPKLYPRATRAGFRTITDALESMFAEETANHIRPEVTMTRAGAAALLFLAAAVLRPDAAAADQSLNEAQAAAHAWDEVYNAGDMDRLSKLYAADAIVVTKGQPQSGPGIATFFSGLKAKGWDDHKVTVKSAQPKGDLLIATGRWAMSGPGEGGARKTFEGNWVNVLERRDGAWRTVLHTWN
jgi:uncharacterized protein (TIGR02246 family)